MKILIVAPAWIGDTVLAQPLFMRLHNLLPDLTIDALAPRWVAPVLGRMAEIRHCIDSPFQHGQLDLAARRALARRLATEKYDAAIVLPNSLKSALIPWLAGIPLRIGFTGEARYGLLNYRLKLDKQALPTMAERFAALAAPWLEKNSQPPLATPRLQTSPAQQAHTLAALGLARPARLVVCCPGAEYGPAKRWPAHHFASLAQHLIAGGSDVWLLGSAKDKPVGDAISGSAPACRNLCGSTNLEHAIDLLALADAVVCNDSGLMHIAAAVGTPLVALYGSSSPGFTPPLSAQATVLSRKLACSPCFKRECPLGHLDCLEKLPAEAVQAALPENLQ